MENVLSLYPGQSWDTSILPVLSSYGEPFMDAVCRDSCDGHDVGRVSYFTVLISRILGGGCPTPTPQPLRNSCEDDGNYDNSYLFYMGFSLAQVHKASMKLKLQHVKSNVPWYEGKTGALE